ncbi:MAG TPA: XRE family transcriptional regulator [Ruminococcaceae bacterium]|jgi:DNA-binding XRE family transcriptional regulator|nr:XRE family transcriptional regulator [Oscillospiraceae bacterium]
MINFSIAQARKFSGKTQKEMAKSLGICVDTYRKIERHPEKTTIPQGTKISQITGIPFEQISFG